MVQKIWRVKSWVTIDGRVLEALKESWKCKGWSFVFFCFNFDVGDDISCPPAN